jgi:hypothetical protein
MEWIGGVLEKRAKSVTSNAQTAVVNMQNMMNKQSSRIKQLEAALSSSRQICVDSLQTEINRLERHKHELLLDLDTTEFALADRKNRLQIALKTMDTLLSNADANLFTEHANGTTTRERTSSSSSTGEVNKIQIDTQAPAAVTSTRSNGNSGDGAIFSLSSLPPPATGDDELEDEYLEEMEMLDSVRDILAPTHLLFVLQHSDEEDILVYTPSLDNPAKVVHTSILSDDSGAVPPSPVEGKARHFEAQIVPNHDREHPDVKEMNVPKFALASLINFHAKKGDKSAKASGRLDGQLIGACEIPATQDLVIDVWQTKYWTWATTSVNGVKFAVLERISLTFEPSTDGDEPILSQIDLFARHPEMGHIMVESIYITSG